jgi:hypothetical protein
VDSRTPAAPPAALRALRRRVDPADPGAQNNLGVVLLARGMRDEAVAAFSRALALDPHMRLAERNLAVAADGPWAARRERELRARLRADAGDTEARRELARLHTARGRHDAARAEVDALHEHADVVRQEREQRVHLRPRRVVAAARGGTRAAPRRGSPCVGTRRRGRDAPRSGPRSRRRPGRAPSRTRPRGCPSRSTGTRASRGARAWPSPPREVRRRAGRPVPRR